MKTKQAIKNKMPPIRLAMSPLWTLDQMNPMADNMNRSQPATIN